MLIEEEMKLIKSWSRKLEVGFFVEIAQSDAVGQQLVEALGHFETHGLFQVKWQHMRNGTVGLNFRCMLVNPGLGADCGLTSGRDVFLRHADDLLKALRRFLFELRG